MSSAYRGSPVWLDCASHAGTGSIAAKVRSCVTTALGIVGAFVATFAGHLQGDCRAVIETGFPRHALGKLGSATF